MHRPKPTAESLSLSTFDPTPKTQQTALRMEPLLEFFFMKCNGIKKTTGDSLT